MPDKDDTRRDRTDPSRDDLLYPETAEEDAGSEPGVLGPNADQDLEGDESPVEEARRQAYGDEPPAEEREE
jgi:hypothetical protein